MAVAPASRSVSLYPMLPACRSGKIKTFALPATVEPGAFDLPTADTSAASACNSPSTL
jgi:hypothetical protein